MKREFESKLKSKKNILKAIGVFEIVGGITGIGLIFWLASQGFQTDTRVLFILLFTIAFYAYSIFAGFRLFKKLENGIFHSQILQYLQIPAISMAGTTYLLTSGANFFLGYNSTEGNLSFKASLISSEFQINIMTSEINNYLYVNILATIMLVLLNGASKTIEEQKKLKSSYEENIKKFKEGV